MNVLQDRRVLAACGAALAIVAGVAVAALFALRGKPDVGASGNRSLTVEMSEVAKVDPSRELRCFVGGQLIGTATLADCAKRNGVSAQALDVGLTETGELAAGGDLAPLQPLENATVPAEPPPADAVDVAMTNPPPVVQANEGECLRFGGDGWRVVGSMPLNACIQQLFDGRCERPGEALYGRWGAQTLRLASTRVESSNNNRDFATLVEQGPNCALPPL